MQGPSWRGKKVIQSTSSDRMEMGKAQLVRKRNVNRENCELLFFAHIHNKSEQVLTSRTTGRRCVAAKKDPWTTFQDHSY